MVVEIVLTLASLVSVPRVLGALRETLSRIEVYKSETKQICQIALCDNVHKDAAEDELDKSKVS